MRRSDLELGKQQGAHPCLRGKLSRGNGGNAELPIKGAEGRKGGGSPIARHPEEAIESDAGALNGCADKNAHLSASPHLNATPQNATHAHESDHCLGLKPQWQRCTHAATAGHHHKSTQDTTKNLHQTHTKSELV